MYGPRYVWVLLERYDEHWWLSDMGDIGCSTAELSEAVAGYWSVNSLSTIGAGQETTSGMVRAFVAVAFVCCVPGIHVVLSKEKCYKEIVI